MDKHAILQQAIEITKEYAKGGGTNPAGTLESIYEELKKLYADTGTLEA
jgi:hypothetical protein